jgi:glycosyltransferase involved in cell wall biosynthesis
VVRGSSRINDGEKLLPPLEDAAKLIAEKRWPEAARLLRIALSSTSDPATSDPALWTLYGQALAELGYLDEAGTAYSKAQERSGPTLGVLIQLGHWNKITGRFNKALQRYRDADQHPDAGFETKQQLRAVLDPLRRVTRGAGSQDDIQLFFSCVAGPVGAVKPLQGLGRANYSYSFAMRGFQRAADEIGVNWLHLDAPHYVPDTRMLTRLDRPVHLAFYPWSGAKLLKGAYNILVFAWEFDALPNERNWAHAFSRPGVMLDVFDEIWLPSNYAAKVVQRYTARPVSWVPSPILPSTASRYADPPLRSARRSPTAAVRELHHVEWVPLAVFPRMQANLNDDAVARRRRTREVLNDHIDGKAPKVYLAVFNPHDRRKQIRPMVEGFIKFSRHVPDALLLLKTVSPDDTNHSINSRLLSHQLAESEELLRPFVSERVWISNAVLSETEMSALYALSSYYLCTSYAEGQNLPLLEAMHDGVIPVSACHTAMADYLNPSNSIIIPHTFREAPQIIQATYRLWGQSVHVVTAEDVCRALHTAHNLAPADADQISFRAAATVRKQCGSLVVKNALSKALPPLN